MEDLTVRTRRVHDFVARFKPGLTYDVVSINDVYGPTGWDPDIQALVVSRETVSGADSSKPALIRFSRTPQTDFLNSSCETQGCEKSTTSTYLCYRRDFAQRCKSGC